MGKRCKRGSKKFQGTQVLDLVHGTQPRQGDLFMRVALLIDGIFDGFHHINERVITITTHCIVYWEEAEVRPARVTLTLSVVTGGPGHTSPEFLVQQGRYLLVVAFISHFVFMCAD